MSHFESLYVHFPFCESKCHYCDFYSIGREKTTVSETSAFEKAILNESSLWKDRLAPKLKTIFFGGGTPSMTAPDVMKKVLKPLDLPLRVDTSTEWTMEANPSSVDLDRLKAYRDFGVNRISMGVQAMRDDLLTSLGRVHSRTAALDALKKITQAGFSNFSVDLLCGVPNQSLQDLDEAMDRLTDFPITHLSCYLLTLPKTHRMFKQLPNEDMQLEHLLFIDQKMRSLGFRHYEISNFAKPGFEAKHNLVYWQGQSYLGLGPSAHSFDQNESKRWKNISSLHAYASKLLQGIKPIEWDETLNPEQKEIEKWLLALRLDQGFPSDWLLTSHQKAKANQLKQTGHLEEHPDHQSRLRLTAKGFAVSDQIISTLMGT